MAIEKEPGLVPPYLYDVVAFTGSHEVRALTYAAMQPRVPYVVSAIHRRVMDIQGADPAWEIHRNGPHEFCGSFASIGLATEKRIGSRAARAFTVEDRARQLVLPLVGHLLDLSLEEDQSLLEIFGPPQTSSRTGVRPCERRLKVMDKMRHVSGEATTMTDISGILEVQLNHAGMITDDLAASEIISKESAGRGKPMVRYMVKPDLAGAGFRQDVSSQLLHDVVECLREHSDTSPDAPVSNADIAAKLIASGKYHEPKNDLTAQIHAKTGYLANYRGLLKAIHEIPMGDTRQIIWATPGQLTTINKVLDIIEGVQAPTDDYLESGRKKARTIIDDPELVNHLVAKAKRSSLGLKTKPGEQRRIRSSLEDILRDSPVPLARREIQAALLESGDNLDVRTINNHIRSLMDLGGIAVTETNEGHKYSKDS